MVIPVPWEKNHHGGSKESGKVRFRKCWGKLTERGHAKKKMYINLYIFRPRL